MQALSGIIIIKLNLFVTKSHSSVGVIKYIYTCLNGPTMEPVPVNIHGPLL